MTNDGKLDPSESYNRGEPKDYIEELFDEYFPSGTATINDRKDDDKALLLTQVIEYRRTQFKSKVLAFLQKERADAIASYKKVNDLLENEIRIDELNRVNEQTLADETIGETIWDYLTDRLAQLRRKQ